MKKPWLIGLFSIIPGLGYLVLGLLKAAVIIFFSAALLVYVTATVQWETLALTSGTLALVLWITQGYYAVLIAGRRIREEAGLTLPTRNVAEAPLPFDASLGEKHLHKARLTVLELLQPGENLVAAVEGRTGTTTLFKTLLGYGSLDIKVIYLGATDRELIFVTTDRLGKPEKLQRIPFKLVTSVEVKETSLSDWMNISLDGSEPINVEIPRSSRGGTQKLASILQR